MFTDLSINILVMGRDRAQVGDLQHPNIMVTWNQSIVNYKQDE